LIETLKIKTSITELNLENNNFVDEDFKNISNMLQINSTLTKLNISSIF
jgi:Ran GTPase-activating protein (RanGAP) involved in mRNA processing and transport